MLRPFCFDATHCPDLFPPLVALAAYAHGTSVIEGCERLLHKESNRALTLQQEFAKLGVVIALKDNKMMIEGSGTVNAAQVFSHNDHRIAMACAVAALGAKGAVDIEAAEAINKSYPAFLNHLQLAGIMVIYFVYPFLGNLMATPLVWLLMVAHLGFPLLMQILKKIWKDEKAANKKALRPVRKMICRYFFRVYLMAKPQAHPLP